MDEARLSLRHPEYPWLRAIRAGDGLMVTGEDQRILAWNRKAETLLDVAAPDALGKTCYDIVGGCDRQSRPVCRPNCSVARAAAQGQALPSHEIVTRDGQGQQRLLNMSTLVIEAGDDRFLLHLFQRRDDPRTTANTEEPLAASRPLSRRETEVTRLLAKGATTREIAEALTISPVTARNHIDNIMTKLGAHSRLQAVLAATRLGLVGETT